MTIELSTDEARVLLVFIDTTLKAKGIEALDAAAIFKTRISQAQQKEQNEQAFHANRHPDNGQDQSVDAPRYHPDVAA